MNQFILFFLLTILSINQFILGNDTSQIHIMHWTDKSEYLEGEPVYLHVRLTNNSNISFMFMIQDSRNILILDQDGKIYSSILQNIIFYRENIFPNSVYENSLEIRENNGIIYQNTFFPYIPAGLYTIQIRILDESKKIDITSQPISFKVNQARGKQRQVFNDFITIQELHSKRNERQNYREALRSFINKYLDDAVYRPLAYYYLQLSYKNTDQARNKEYLKLCDQMLHEYPAHPYTRRVCQGILRHFRLNNDQSGAEAYFKRLYDETTIKEFKDFIGVQILPKIQDKPMDKW